MKVSWKMVAGYFWRLSESADHVSTLGTSAKWLSPVFAFACARPIGAYIRSSKICISHGNFCRLGVLLWPVGGLHQRVHYSIWLVLENGNFVPRCLPHSDFMLQFCYNLYQDFDVFW